MEVKQRVNINDLNLNTQQQELIFKDLQFLLKTNSSVPTHTPKRFLDQFYLYYDGSTTYELYVYINNEWKKITLT